MKTLVEDVINYIIWKSIIKISLLIQSKLRYEQDLAELEQRRREFEAEKAEWEKRIENDKVSQVVLFSI